MGLSRHIARVRLSRPTCPHVQAYTKKRGVNPKYSLDEMLAGAQELLDELAGAPTQPQNVDDYAFILAFHRYPTGQAHA